MVVQPLVSRSDVRAVIPRAATAVENDELVFRRFGDDALEQFQSVGLRTRAGIDEPGNVRLAIHDMRAHLQHQGLDVSTCLQHAVQCVGLNELGLRNRKRTCRRDRIARKLSRALRHSENVNAKNANTARELFASFFHAPSNISVGMMISSQRRYSRVERLGCKRVPGAPGVIASDRQSGCPCTRWMTRFR